jgi:hypothetical protein
MKVIPWLFTPSKSLGWFYVIFNGFVMLAILGDRPFAATLGCLGFLNGLAIIWVSDKVSN